MEVTNLNQQLQELFREAGEAHHQAYIETDGVHPEWPLWYAWSRRTHPVLSRTSPYHFMYVVQVHILDDAQKGAEDGSRTPRHIRWLWKNRPSAPL